MLFLPLDRKPDWKNPPLVTLTLVVLNVLIFYIWQHNDDRYQQEAWEHYYYSGLYKYEMNAFAGYRELDTDISAEALENNPDKFREIYIAMVSDAEFQQKLNAEQIIRPGDENYLDWHDKHDKYRWLKDRVVSDKYALVPSNPTLLTLLTNLFLHADNTHLIGNMVFLFMMGFVVEIVLGRLIFFVGYMFAGLSADLLYILLFSDQAVGTIGASGAVAGIMGMYIALFGLRKIRFFYYLFVYFDYVRAPAIIILPLYIITQLYIQFGQDTPINVTAHLGGLIGGLIVALIAKRFQHSINSEYMDQNVRKEQYQQDYEQAQQLLASMKIDEAREKFETLLKQYPSDLSIKQQLFTISKYNPASEPYHQYAHQLLNLPGSDRTTVKIIHDTFSHYASAAKPRPRWTPQLLITIAIKFAANGYLDDAEKLVNYLIKVKKDFAPNAEGLSALAKYYNGINKQKVIQYQQLLLQLYPDSTEASHIQRLQIAGNTNNNEQ